MAVLLTFMVLHSASLAIAASSPSPTAQVNCTAAMDGKLPSFTPADFHWSGNVRRYYIAAEEIEWDYAPTGWDNWLGVPLNVSPRAQAAGYVQAGTKWKKAVYRGYTDASFSQKSPQPPWQGIQGPTIRSEVGDMIEILFRNNLPKHYATMHSMGLAYTKDNEGSDYPNSTYLDPNTTRAPGGAVPPGGCVVYKWVVNDGSAPNPSVPANMHGYHSFVSMEQDVNAGLVGPQMTYQRGMMDYTMSHYREFPVLYMEFDESASFMARSNAGQLANMNHNYTISADLSQYGNSSYWSPQLTNLLSSFDCSGNPVFYSINGWVYGNNPTFKMCVNDDVIWYLYSFGSHTHVFHMHGNGFTFDNTTRASKTVNPGNMFALYSKAVGVGFWQLICHVAEHLSKGMVSYYWVMTEDCPPIIPGGV